MPSSSPHLTPIYSVLDPQTLTGAHTQRVALLTLLCSDRILAAASEDNTITLWDTEESLPYLACPALRGHTNTITALIPLSTPGVEEAGNILVSGSRDGTVRMWNVSEGDPLPISILRTDVSVSALAALHPKGLGIGCANGEVWIGGHHPQAQQPPPQQQQHQQQPPLIFEGAHEGCVTFMSSLPPQCAPALMVSGGGASLCVWGATGVLHTLWGSGTSPTLQPPPLLTALIHVPSGGGAGGGSIAAGWEDGSLKLWRMEDGGVDGVGGDGVWECAASVRAHTGAVTLLQSLTQGGISGIREGFMSGGEDGLVKVWRGDEDKGGGLTCASEIAVRGGRGSIRGALDLGLGRVGVAWEGGVGVYHASGWLTKAEAIFEHPGTTSIIGTPWGGFVIGMEGGDLLQFAAEFVAKE
jgi:WD40 repeat protein